MGIRMNSPAEFVRNAYSGFINREPDPNKRLLLKAGVAFLVASVLPPSLVFAQRSRTWIDDEWGPLADDIRSRLTGLVLHTFHGDGQIGEVYDRVAREVFGKETSLRAELKASADENLTASPDSRSTLGHCGPITMAAILGEAPQTLLQKQAAALKHAGDVKIQISLEEAIYYMKKGQMVGVDLPEEPGTWFRAGLEYNPRTREMLVTSYGFPDKWLPIDMIARLSDGSKKMFIPIHGDRPIDDLIGERFKKDEKFYVGYYKRYAYESGDDEIFDYIINN